MKPETLTQEVSVNSARTSFFLISIGYFYLRVADMDEAVAIAMNCPGLEYRAMIEVRPVGDICGVFEQAQQVARTALAEV